MGEGRVRVPSSLAAGSSLPEPGSYTLVLAAGAQELSSIGDGIATLALDANGRVKLEGTLADGTSIKHQAVASSAGFWPVYLPLYGGKGSLSGWLFFTNKPTTDIAGQLGWFKPENPKDRFYPEGIARTLSVIASRYRPPADEQSITDITRGVLALKQGNLPRVVGFLVDIQPPDKVKFDPELDPKFALRLQEHSGLFNGAFTHLATGKSASFHGVLLQKLNWGSGFFLGTNESGMVFLGPDNEPPPDLSQPPPPSQEAPPADQGNSKP
jgi:hypothetical protein